MWKFTHVFFCCNIDFYPTFMCINVSIYPSTQLLKKLLNSFHCCVTIMRSDGHCCCGVPERLVCFFICPHRLCLTLNLVHISTHPNRAMRRLIHCRLLNCCLPAPKTTVHELFPGLLQIWLLSPSGSFPGALLGCFLQCFWFYNI